ncbi:MAG: hypothetical protein ACPGYK_07970 [Flavobacteriales bacterium]
MKRFYETERGRLIGQLMHVEQMLEKITGSPLSPRQLMKGYATRPTNRPKKRGPKSIWGNFIVKRLRGRNRPMTYRELIDDAMSIHHLPAEKEGSVRASILNSAFRLRTVHGRVETIGRAGRKEKFLVLTNWLDDDGMLKMPYDKEFKALTGGKHVAVDMNAIPAPKYSDDESEFESEIAESK